MVAISQKSMVQRPPMWKVWLVAARPHTLTAAIAPCIVGSCVAFSETGHFPTQITSLWTLFCIFVQLGTNLHNDYADFVKGADTDARVGQARATQKGWLTPQQTAMGATAVLMGNLIIGLYFLWELKKHGKNNKIDWLFLCIVISSIFNAFAYTGGPYPLGYIGLGDFSIGYSGLGDIFVFLYFGCVATIAIPYLYHRTVVNPSESVADALHYLLLNPQKPTMPLAATAVGLMATNILVVNNLRDRHTDIHAGKRTLAVRLGGTFCRVQYTLQALASYLLVLLDYTLHEQLQQDQQQQQPEIKYIRLLPLLSLPLARKEIEAIWNTDGKALNSHVGKTALLELVFCILLGVALVKAA
ncbi:naphthoate octaprenyltransferase [Seminavis robusta]|uniref:Naphthoate octaprenyltransferase n=1 Tax=Seminavis robusta TaxID=568900 RepID=A0A9N8DMX5_9STRA|nr:naphthoate octaprenyltransferase [Seminavis robusta]|eukprot:Sro143_g066730.1 naphthoate octaprenyltransferase (357) ;mRNA; f:84461-85531